MDEPIAGPDVQSPEPIPPQPIEPVPQPPTEALPEPVVEPAPQAPPELPAQPPKKNFSPKFIMVIAGLLVLGGIAYGAIWYWQNSIADTAIIEVSVTPRVSPVVSVAPVVQRYIVTQGIAYNSNQEPAATHFSIFDSAGTLFKTVSIPADSLFAGLSMVKVFGNKIYYMSGTQQLTSLGEINIQTGVASVLKFTETINTNIGNTYAAIVGWTVSADNSKIAWLNTDGQIIVANADGSNIKIYSSGALKPIISNLSFAGNNVYFDMENKLMKIDLNTGSVSVIKDAYGYSISDSGRYLAFVNTDNSLTVKDISSGTDVTIPSNGRTLAGSTMAFSPDETEIIFSEPILPGQDRTELNVINLKSGTAMSSVKDFGILGFVSNQRAVVFNSSVKPSLIPNPYIVDLDGGNAKTLPDEEFLGILSAIR